jgi:hypothetical protein
MTPRHTLTLQMSLYSLQRHGGLRLPGPCQAMVPSTLQRKVQLIYPSPHLEDRKHNHPANEQQVHQWRLPINHLRALHLSMIRLLLRQ